jgi:N utilization substance protein B
MSRRGAREVALKTLFVLDFDPQAEVETALTTAREDVEGVTDKDVEYSRQLITGTKAKQAEIDEQLGKLSKEWQLNRMGAIDRNILRMACYEIRYGEEKVPASVAINEAVELAKSYGTDESAGFINGILGTLVRNDEQ